MNRKHLFFYILFLTSCSLNNSAPDPATQKKIAAFNKFRKKFKLLHLPLTLQTFDIQSTDALRKITGRDSVYINSGYPNETWAYGFLADTTDNIKLVWLSPAEVYVPVLTTFTKEGQKIAEQHLSVGQCGSDCCFSCTESIHINRDLAIYAVDSIKSCTCDNDGPKEETMRKYIKYKKGAISPDGQITMSEMQQKELSSALHSQ